MPSDQVPIDCAVCGFFLGSGIPGETAYCTQCQRFVVAKSKAGNLGAILGAVAVVGIGIGLGILAGKILNDIFDEML